MQTNFRVRLSHVELSDFELRVGDTDVSSVPGLDPDKEKLCHNHLCSRIGDPPREADGLLHRVDCSAPVQGRRGTHTQKYNLILKLSL